MNMEDDQTQKRDDLEEAARLEEAAQTVPERLRPDLLAEATALRARWTAPAEMVALATVSSDLREADLAEADRIERMATSLKAGSAGRAALEAEVEALRAKWPDFDDSPEGQVQRIGAYLLSRKIAHSDTVPARAVLARVAELEATVKKLSDAPRNCHACGIPHRAVGEAAVNSFLVSAVEFFEKDDDFRDQVLSGQVQAGKLTHPWQQASPPHRGPNATKSPWAIADLAQMLRYDAYAAQRIGPKLREVLKKRGILLPQASTQLANGHAN
jgi:hypothetical protein